MSTKVTIFTLELNLFIQVPRSEMGKGCLLEGDKKNLWATCLPCLLEYQDFSCSHAEDHIHSRCIFQDKIPELNIHGQDPRR